MRKANSIISARPPVPLLKSQSGMSLVLVLVVMVILGMSAGIAGSSWSSLVRHAREADLLWKGGQIRQAIGSYYLSSHGKGSAKIYPSKLEYLLKDPRFLQTKRHLRRPYLDPMTGQDWEVIKDPSGRIKGVHTSFAEEPFKQENFSEENKDFAGRGLYSEWEFIYTPAKETPAAVPQPATPGSKPAENVPPVSGVSDAPEG